MEYILSFAAGFGLLQALSELLVPDKQARNYFAAGFFICLGLIFLHAAGLSAGLFADYPVLYGWSLALAAWAGPFLYYYLSLNLGTDGFQPGRLAVELLPGSLAIVFIVAAHPALMGLGFASLAEVQRGPNLWTAGALLVFGYNGWFIFRFIGQLRRTAGSLRTVSKIVVPAVKVYLFFGALVMLLHLLSFAFNSPEVRYVAQILLIGEVIAPFLYYRRHPEMLDDWLERLEQTKYRNSHLGPVNVNEVRRRFDELMNEDELYTDDAISLHSLAEQLGLNRHQLSEFFNTHLHMGFTDYINLRRVQAAQHLLSETDNTVIRIGFQVGFASKSAFNRSFRKITGTTPTAYRRASQKKSAG